MPKNSRIKTLKFHVRSDDYFGTLASILDLLKQDFEEKTFIFDKDILLENIVNDLMHLQENYKITKKD